MLETASAVIDELGGTGAVARMVGYQSPAVSNWRRQGFFPPDTYVVLSGALAASGKEAPPSLWRMVEPQVA